MNIMYHSEVLWYKLLVSGDQLALSYTQALTQALIRLLFSRSAELCCAVAFKLWRQSCTCELHLCN